jgi:hydrogenase maturation protein HypF
MLSRELNAPVTSSIGRLFDAVAALLGIAQINDFEGQAACALEYAADTHQQGPDYSLKIRSAVSELKDSHTRTGPSTLSAPRDDTHTNTRYQSEKPLILDWQPLLIKLLADRDAGVPVGAIALGFHRALAALVVELAQLINEPIVVLSGGCFQNKALTEMVVNQLRVAGFSPYTHHQVPPNDGGLSTGQAYYTACMLAQENLNDIR